jgi:hypothetical protein
MVFSRLLKVFVELFLCIFFLLFWGLGVSWGAKRAHGRKKNEIRTMLEGIPLNSEPFWRAFRPETSNPKSFQKYAPQF